MHQTTLRFLTGLLLAAICTSAFSTRAVAQNESPSHRRLELPDSGPSDFQRQMLLMQHLQSQMANRKPSDTPSDNSGNSLNARDLQAFQQLMKNLGGNMRPEDFPRPEDLPPELIQSILGDRNVQRQLKDVFDEFKRTGRVPAGGSGNGPGLPPPQDGTRYPTPGRPTGRDTDATQNGETQRKVHNREEFLNMFDDIVQGYRDRLNDDPGTSDSRQPNNSGQGRGQLPPDSSAEWIDYLDQIVNTQSGNNSSSNQRSPGTNDSRPNGNQGNSIGEWVNRFNPNSQSQNSSTSRSKNGNGTSTLENFLQDMKNRPLEPLPQTDPANNAAGQGNRSSTGGTAAVPSNNGTGTTVTGSDPASPEIRQKIERTKSTLQSRGLKQTFRELVRNARSEAKSKPTVANGNGSSATSAPEMEGALLQAMDGIRQDVVQMVKDGKFKFRKPDPSNTSRSGSSRSMSSRSKPSIAREIQRTARNWLNDVASAPVTRPMPEATASRSGADSASVVFSGSGAALLSALVGVMIGGLFVLRELRAARDKEAVHGHHSRITSDQIRTRDDVVQAFHAVALKPGQNAEEWWTHRKVVSDMVSESPEHEGSVSVLADLYEQARYLPADADLTEEQLQQARMAYRQCRR